SIIHDTITDQLSCSIEASLDLFNPSTTYKIGQRFQILLQQLFTSNVINETCQSIHESSIILPNEKILIASTINTQTLFSSSNHCIQHEFIQQVNKQPQKIAIKLDEQSLTYNELLYYAQCLSLEFLTNSNYIPGNVVGQCIDRSISMFIGMLSIIMAGGSYCPLSPRDHEHRLQSLIEQTRSNIVLVDWTTQNKFEDKTMMININTMIINNNNETINTNHLDLFSTFTINSKNVAFVIFTSGSTGTPKAVQIMHRNLLNCMSSFNDLGILTKDDTVIQMAQCTFDVHVKECLGTLLVGGSVVQLHPEGTMDYNYLSKTLQQHHITFFGVVPSVMTILYNYLIDIKQLNRLDTIRKFGFLGEAIDTRTLAKMINYFDVNTTAYYNLYGPAETTLTSIYHRVIIHEINDGIIAIGIPFPNMQVHLIDSFNQSVIVGQEGELLISGSGVFAGYLGRDDLTSKALVEINKKQFYQTGDLARMNSNGLVYYLGRKDHQVKIHGQRIELDEIQRCLLDTSISACVAIKWGNDHLIAYVQSNDNNVEYLRDHCRSRLPPFMVPSMFIVLGKFPLNANGKLDRKLLPQPNFSSSSMKTTDIQHTNPNNSIEEKLLSIWCEILHRNNNNEQDEISTSANFFTVGGHSLLFIQLYHRYQSIFSFTNELLPIALFLQKTTIIEHAKLLESIKSTDVVKEETWQSLHLIKGMASFAQERIYLDQQVRFMNNVSVYNELIILKLLNDTLSKSRLQRAIQSVLEKHQILRTCLILDTDAGTLTQCITQNHLMFMFNTEKTFKNNNELNLIIFQIKTNPNLFNLSSGHVFCCEILRQYSSIQNNDLLQESDILVFAFHHVAYDRASTEIFFDDLNIAYEHDKPVRSNEDTFQYIDFAVYERKINMNLARQFWHAQLNGYNAESQRPFSMDRYRIVNDQRSSYTVHIEFSLDDNLSRSFLSYASTHEITPFQLGLAMFYIFMFKLTNGTTDLCAACTSANRYRSELLKLVGMFVATLPYRTEINPYNSLEHFVEQVREKCFSITEHSHYPLQHILADFQQLQSTISFLENAFDFVTHSLDTEKLTLCNSKFVVNSTQLIDDAAKFDWLLTFVYSPSAVHDIMSIGLVCSQDLFDQNTVDILGSRFELLFQQLFDSNSSSYSLYDLSIILPHERILIDPLMNKNTDRQSQGVTVGDLFQQQVENHPQKLAVLLDEQSLTYSELLYYVQQLALQIINNYDIKSGDIICQLAERSLSMIVGSLSIEIIGGVYCPLSPENPEQRLRNLVEQTQAHLILLHSLTNQIFQNNSITYDMDTIINCNDKITNDDLCRLSNISITPDNISYIVFTSGSTGIPKAVQVRHRNLTAYMQSFAEMTTLKKSDNVIQMASCSFDNHFQDIFITLMIGAGLIMLHPHGNKDLTYLIHELMDKDVTVLDAVPSYLDTLCQHLEIQNATECLKKLRTLCSGGDVLTNQIMSRLKKYVSLPSSPLSSDGCQLWNMYGQAEATITTTYFQIGFDFDCDKQVMSIGKPLPNYHCAIMDEYFQFAAVNQEGELFVGGECVFAGYFGRDDLTAKVLVEINNNIFYRSGDLVRYDQQSFLYFKGRKDHQVKLRGQRIELAEIEKCLMNTCSLVSACTVIKWNEQYLVAYVQCIDVNEELLLQHCRSHLPSYMVPSKFILLERFPLNANGKLDRKCLPQPDFSSLTIDHDASVPYTTLEQQLQNIFSQAFHIESPPIEVPFGQLGGTSLNAILALTLIRQQICTNIDILLLFSNPSIRQLAQAIEPLLIVNESQDTIITSKQDDETHIRSLPSPFVESIGIILLICQWVLPIMIIMNQCQPFLFLILPIFHLVLYVICSRLFSFKNNKPDNIFSWNYYRWWFLDRLWNNNRFWLQHIIGTPLYNYYLRLCGAHVSIDAHIYTTIMDAPWLLDIDDRTWIADQTFLNCLHFNDDNTFELYPISIASNCSIGTRTILYDGVNIEKNVIIQPMSSVNGFVASQTIIDGDDNKSSSTNTFMAYNNRSLSIWHKLFQLIALCLLICIHSILLIIIHKVYSIVQVPLPINIALCWTLWSILGCFISVLLLKFIVGSCAAGETYPIASWSYLHKLWLRQLVVSSFHHAWLLPNSYDHIYPIILRWLGAHIEDNVKIGEIHTFLSYPTNLLHFERGVTTFGSVLLVPTELTLSGDHYVDYITLGSYTNLGNGCSILPGSHLESEIMIGNLTCVSRETKSNTGDVFIGVPARAMPFKMPLRSSLTTTTTTDEMKIIPIWHTCFTHFISKSLLLTIYSLTGVVGMLIIHTILICIIYRYRSYVRYPAVQQIISRLNQDHQQFICPFFGNTQWLINLFRAFGAHIGEGVIIPDFSCLTDYHLITIGDNVRFSIHANIQCHSFEQRILKLAPVTIRKSCVLMSGSFVMAGCKLMGNNRLYPFTLVMKNDILLPNTQWKGLPARLLTTKAASSQSELVRDNEAEQQQSSENVGSLSFWYEWIANTYSNVDELQFMNYGYADLDEHNDDNSDYCSKQLYKEVLAHVSLTNQNVLEVNCGRGAGAVWCVHNYAPGSYVGADLSPGVIDVCRQRHSMISRLSFVVADATKYLPFDNESLDIVLCVEATHAYGGPTAVQRFANEVARVLRPNGYFLWCDLCHIDGSDTSIDYLTTNGELIVEEKINITKNVLHALDIQSNTRAEFIERYVRPKEQEYFRLFAGLPGTQMYNGMYEGHIQYWRAVFRKKTTTDMTTI
ncbi:unnamed protein product, partial [Adineta steineri]